MFAVLTISDRASADASIDTSGPIIRSKLESTTSLRFFGSAIVPDDVSRIRDAVRSFCAEKQVDLVITTGGTGFGVRDCTPEAIGPLLERQAPGIVHLLVSSSLAKTPFAALSRPVAGTIGSTLVITLPGSAKAVKECVDALLAGGILGHALDLITGGSGEGVHKALASAPAAAAPESREHAHAHDHAHTHHHHDHSHSHGHTHARPRLAQDPSASVALRQRVSPFPIIPLEDALAIIADTVPVLTPISANVGPHLRGHVLAEDVYAPNDAPENMTTNVDVYAAREPAGTYQVLSAQSWSDRSKPIPRGHIYRINTGAPLPLGCDAVVMVEDTELVSSELDHSGKATEEKQVKILVQVAAQENVRLPGSDVKKGDLVLRKGQVITPLGGEVGTLAFVGKKDASPRRKPVVALLSTGNELRDLSEDQNAHEDTEAWGGIWDTNRPSLHTALASLGYEVVDFGIVPDDFVGHRDKIKAALNKADLVLTTGGSSMGSSDLLKPVIEDLGGIIHFGRVAVKPGKPTTFATVAHEGARADKVIFALPGNPASALVCFNLFVIPALRRLAGFDKQRCQLPRVRVQAKSMRLDPRPEFHRAVIRRTATGQLKAYSTGGQRSSRVASLSGANGLVALPGWKEGEKRTLDKDELADAVVVGEIEMEW
ncbi:hypothetical protein EXIGLDRAFT_599420 [Exidia glandulosa HHB12029]|uniref:MoaB/Mog domain-containing protein n=1 Tax=Exidia glandulosa HHB12029 TaxID=1314781 RepID=A0A165QXE2_EXIGL|nr:hypothetical protein EXIGLDRAFT_599420 [Exidia glandulosa HHB12029]